MVFHESYWKRDGKVYFCDSTVKGADFETFRPLSGVWAVDKKYVYEVGCKLRRADLTSFLVLNEVYARDNATSKSRLSVSRESCAARTVIRFA